VGGEAGVQIRVSAAQLALGRGDYLMAVENATKLVREASEQGAGIVCFPEHWLLEYREHGQRALEQLCDAARETRIFVITGANYMPDEAPKSTELRVRSILIGPDGNRIGQQDKIHLYRSERKVAKPGEVYNVFQTTLGKIGILICYDAMFPEAARTLALKGADLIFVPSRIGAVALDPWILYLRTRSLENRIPIVAPNVFRPPKYIGGTFIVDLDAQRDSNVVLPRVVASAKSGEQLILADVNVELARGLRKERFLDRRPSAYFGH
jgi:predicted amidohydrolase